MKKCKRDYETGNTVEYFSRFIVDSLSYLEDNSLSIDRVSFNKACLCLSTTIEIDNNVHIYHPSRSCDMEILEGVVAFVIHTFKRYGCNGRSLQVCFYQVSIIIRWLFSGKSLYLPFSAKEIQYFRKAKRDANICAVLLDLWPEIAYDFIHDDTNIDTTICYCACCFFDKEKVELYKYQQAETYKSSLVSFGHLYEIIFKHKKFEQEILPVSTASVICTHSMGCALRSYTYYGLYSHVFPRLFKDANILLYYKRILTVHERYHPMK